MPLSSAPSQQAVETPRTPRWERGAIGTLFLLILAFKLWYLRALTINSDEPQHLHVAWGWTQGMLQYRDFFDNHTPLFHLAMAPLVAWIGEQADILFRMRLAMLPLFAASLGCLYGLGARLYSRRAGIWAALLAATCPVFLLKTSEFRADVLWMALWMAALAVGLSGPFTRRRAFATGLLLGVTASASVKTLLLLLSLLASLAVLLALLPKPDRKPLLIRCLGNALPTLAGLCLVPLAIAGFFAAKGALPDLLFCVFQHNAIPGHAASLPQMLWRSTLFLFGLAGIGFAARAILRREAERPLALQRTLVFLTGALFLLLLQCFWPLATHQNYLPAVPLLSLSAAPWALRLKKTGAPLLLLVAAGQIAVALLTKSPFSTRSLHDQALVAHVLQLTQPSDFVMDSKGETVFRRRPFYYVLETLTLRRLEMGLLPDTIAQEMARKRTCVALLKRLPEKTRQWVTRYYVPVTWQLFVTGCFLPPSAEAGGPRPFEVAIAAEYVVASAEGPVPGMLDGAACNGPVFLNQGPHTFSCSETGPLAVFWAQAAARGFTPFQAAQNPD